MASEQKIVDAYVEIGARMTGLQAGLATAVKSTQAATAKMAAHSDAVGAAFTRLGRTMTLGVTLPIVAAGRGMVKMAMEAVEDENLFEESMGEMAGAARAWSEQLRKELGLNAYAVRKMVGTFNVMLNSLGLGADEAYEFSKSLTTLVYDMASFYNLPVEDAFTKVAAGITGEMEPLKRLGIVLSEERVNAYAYAHGIAEVGSKLNETQKIQSRYLLLMQDTAKAQGDLARTIDSPSNKMRVLKDRFVELGIRIGEKFLPVMERLMGMFERLLDWWNKLDPKTQNMALLFTLAAAAAGPLLSLIGGLVSGMAGLVSHAGGFVSAIASIFGAVVGGIAALISAAAALAANPVAFAIAAGVGLLAAIGGAAAFAYNLPKIAEMKKRAEEYVSQFRAVMDKVKAAIKDMLAAIGGETATTPTVASGKGRLTPFSGMDKALEESIKALGDSLEKRKAKLEEHLDWIEQWQGKASAKLKANAQAEEDALTEARGRVRFTGIEDIFRQAAVAGAAEQFRAADPDLMERRRGNELLYNSLQESKQATGVLKAIYAVLSARLDSLGDYA